MTAQPKMRGVIGEPDYAAQGYRIVSRKYGIISRIDREDWKEAMAKAHAPWDIEEGRKWVRTLGDRGAADHYRRCYSKDNVELGGRALTLKIPNSNDDVADPYIATKLKYKK